MILKRLLSFALILSIVFSQNSYAEDKSRQATRIAVPLAQIRPPAQSLSTAQNNSNDSTLLSVDIYNFIQLYSASRYQYQLAENDLLQIFERAGVAGVRLTIAAHSALKQGSAPLPDEEKVLLLEAERKMKDDAQKISEDLLKNYSNNIVDRLMKVSSEDELNTQMLVLAQYFLYHPEARGPIREIVSGLQQKINEDYFRNLEKKKTAGYQFAFGGTATVILAGIISLFRPSQAGKGLLTRSQEAIYERVARMLGREKATMSHQAATTAEGAVKREMTKAEALEMLRQLGAYVPRVATTELETKSTLLLKSNIMNRLKSFTARENVKNIFVLTGLSYAAGGAYTGVQQLRQALHKPEFDDNYLDPHTVFVRDYNGLAVLDLQCRTDKLKTEIASRASNENTANATPIWDEKSLKQLNSLIADYELLLEFAPNYAQKRKLTVPTKYNLETKSFKASIVYNGHALSESIPCSQNVTTDEVGLESVLSDILEMTTE